MKHLIALIFVFSSLPAFSYQLRSQIAINQSNELDKRLIMTCLNGETVCQDTCNIANGCILQETICEDCASAKSQLLRTMVTDIKSIFKTDPMFVESVLVSKFFREKKFMTISYDTFLNFFTPEKKDQIKADFESLCYVDVDSAMMLVTLDEKNQMEDLVGTICHDRLGYSSILPMELHPNFSNKTLDFWKNLGVGVKLD
ncbi:MAG: hypothetical protein H7256_03250 [Bdellovibrio sp.]|nr:hypothetical protein [Bdellovibrio sp.]